MKKLLILLLCCSALAASHAHRNDLDKTLLSFQGKPKQGHIEAVKDNYVKQLFNQLLGKKFSVRSGRMSTRVGRSNGSLNKLENPQIRQNVYVTGMDEAMLLHRELQSRLGWGSDDNSNRNQQYGPPPPPPNQQYGPPPQALSQQYGPPPPPPNQQYEPPPQALSQQYGPPPPPPSQQYGPPPAEPNQQYGPPPAQPNQQYGPPPPPPNQQYGPPPQPQYGPPPAQPNQQYGPPPPPPNQQYGPPPQPQYGPPPAEPNQQYGPPAQVLSQQYGPPPQQQYEAPAPSQEYGPPATNSLDTGLRVNHGTFGGHIENFKLSDAVKSNDYSPPPQAQYGPPSQNDISTFTKETDLGGSGKVFKHVYIHSPSREFEDEVPQKPRVIRPNKKPDTHYQIVFVKAPSPPQQPPTEIELPSPPERKTLVYVLVKKPEKPAEIKFRAAPPTQPPKPEVFFIRYKGKNGRGNGASEQQDNLESINGGIVGQNTDGGYSSDYDPQPEILGTKSLDAPVASIANIANSLLKDSAGYPNTEYRAQPNMLSPNQEPMSIAVYDRVRNGVMPSADRGNSLATASSEISTRILRRLQQGSHYTAPGSKPFMRSLGKMVDDQYLDMTSDSSDLLDSQFYILKRRRSSSDFD